MNIKQILYKFSPKRCFTNGTHSLTKLNNDTRGIECACYTSFALYDISLKHGSLTIWTSEIGSRIEYLISSGSFIVLASCLTPSVDKNLISLAGYYKIWFDLLILR